MSSVSVIKVNIFDYESDYLIAFDFQQSLIYYPQNHYKIRNRLKVFNFLCKEKLINLTLFPQRKIITGDYCGFYTRQITAELAFFIKMKLNNEYWIINIPADIKSKFYEN